MDKWLQDDKKLTAMIEALRARLEIRDFFLKTAVRDVYENIGQVLSLVRMQLAHLDTTTKVDINEKIDTSGILIGQSIRDLRVMCKSFYPDADLLKEEGLVEGLDNSIRILFPGILPVIEVKGVRKDIEPDLKLIIFKTVLQLLNQIKDIKGEFIRLVICYMKEEVKFEINYKGKIIEKDSIATTEESEYNSTLQATLQLIKGRLILKQSAHGMIRIVLTSPLKFVL